MSLTQVTPDVISTNTISGLISAGFTSMNVATMGTQTIEFGSSNTLVFRANTSTERMRVSNTGFVGIGTSSPDTTLTVQATGANGINLKESLSNSTLSTRLFFSNATAGQSVAFYNNAGSLLFTTGGTPSSGSGTERLRIDSAGQVGVGVTPNTWSTGKVVEVGNSGTSLWGLASGTSYFTASYYFNSGDKFGVTGNYAQFIQQVPADGSFRFSSSTTTGTAGDAATMTEKMRIDASGNVGIGTSPSYALDVRGTTAPAIRLSRSGSAGQIASVVFEDGTATLGTGNTTRIASDSGAMSFSTGGTSGAVTGGTERMRITANGNVSIAGTAGLLPGNIRLVVEQPSGEYDSAKAMQRWSYATYGVTDLYHDGSVNPIFNTDPQSYWNPPAAMIWQFRGSERMRLKSSGTLILSGGSTSATGTGITFPATQSASSDANTLDDYEEGSWTPVNASIASITLSVTTARYVKIGRQVFVTCYIGYPSTGDTNAAKIGGFPFAATSGEVYSYFSGRTAYSGAGHITWQLGSGSTEANCHGNGGGTTINNNNLSGAYVLFSGSYLAAN